MTKDTENGRAGPNPPDNRTAHWTWWCGIGYGIFGLGIVLSGSSGLTLLALLCIYGGMVVGSVGFVGRWYARSQIRQAPLKIAMCACLILGIGGCIVDMTLPAEVGIPITDERTAFWLGISTNWFDAISLVGWSLFLLGWFVTSFRIK